MKTYTIKPIKWGGQKGNIFNSKFISYRFDVTFEYEDTPVYVTVTQHRRQWGHFCKSIDEAKRICEREYQNLLKECLTLVRKEKLK